MEFIARGILYATTDPKKFSAIINVLGYQTASDINTSLQSTVDKHVNNRLFPGLKGYFSTTCHTIKDIWKYYKEVIVLISYEGIYGGASKGLTYGLFYGLGVCSANSVRSAIKEILSYQKWNQLSYFQNDKSELDTFSWIEVITEWKKMMIDFLSDIFTFELDMIRLQTYVVGFFLSILFFTLYVNIIFFLLYGVIWHGIEYMRIWVGLFFVISGFLWWNAGGGTIVTSFDALPRSLHTSKSKSGETNDNFMYFCVIFFSYSVGYLTNFVFKFPISSTLCAAFFTVCIVSHMSRGVSYRVLLYIYEYYYEWKIFQNVKRFSKKKLS